MNRDERAFELLKYIASGAASTGVDYDNVALVDAAYELADAYNTRLV